MSHIKMILEDNEQILWKGKMDVKSTVILSIFTSIALFAISYIFFAIASVDGGSCLINGKPAPAASCNMIWSTIGWGLRGFALLSLVAPYLYCLVTEYAVTGKRIIIKSGIIGADINSIYYDQIKGLFVDVGLVGKIFTTGSVKLDTGKRSSSNEGGVQIIYDSLTNIKDPYKVYKLIQDNLSNRKESLYSGRADFKYNKEKYRDFIQETERMKKSVS